MIRYILYFFLIFTTSFSTLAESGQKLVIVTGSQSDITSLTPKELRRVFLGLNVTNNNSAVIPIRNHSDEMLHEVFLQKIMFMSSRTYERQLNLRIVRKGLERPKQFSKQSEIISVLTNTNNSITYMWEQDAKNFSDLRVIRTR